MEYIESGGGGSPYDGLYGKAARKEYFFKGSGK